jgi:hypothetical protein
VAFIERQIGATVSRACTKHSAALACQEHAAVDGCVGRLTSPIGPFSIRLAGGLEICSAQQPGLGRRTSPKLIEKATGDLLEQCAKRVFGPRPQPAAKGECAMVRLNYERERGWLLEGQLPAERTG